jgi:hypothetical protein
VISWAEVLPTENTEDTEKDEAKMAGHVGRSARLRDANGGVEARAGDGRARWENFSGSDFWGSVRAACGFLVYFNRLTHRD